MLCPNCKNEIENGSKFCEHCGARVKKSKKWLWITLSVILMSVIATIVVITIQEQMAVEWYRVEQSKIELEQQLQAERIAKEEAEREAELARQEAARKAEAERQAEIARQKEAERQAEIVRQKEAERQAEIARQREARRQELLSQGYVDLGLPSGTLWRNANEGGNDAHYTYDEAIRIYGHNLPTKQQIEELVNYCSFSFQWGKDVNVVTGPNGMSIKFPAACYEDSNGDCYGAPNGYYWSCTPSTQFSGEAYCFYFYDSPIDIGEMHQFYKFSVRLVAD